MSDAAPIRYRRLPGSGTSRKGGSLLTVTRTTCRLWLGDDHLLQVESVGGYSETYRRFYFRDVQTISLHRTSSWYVSNAVLGLLFGASLVLTLAFRPNAGAYVFGVLAGLFGLVLLANALRGPTCACHLQTAVHREELPSLRRRRNAEKVLAQLLPLLEQAQGSPSGETLGSQYTGLLAHASATPAVPGQFARLADPSVTPYRSRAHLVLCLALLADALADVLNIFLPGVPVVLLCMITGATLAVAVLVALVKQHRTDLRPALRALTWVAAGLVGLGYLTGYIMMIVLTADSAGGASQWGYIKTLAELQPLQTTWWLAVLTAFASAAGVLGGLGLLFLRGQRRDPGDRPW